MKKLRRKDIEFLDTELTNQKTYFDYLNRFKKLALSMFEWKNLPKGMNQRYLEQCLYYRGEASLLYDNDYGYLNTQCCSNGNLNIYYLPSSLNCYSWGYQQDRKLYTGEVNYNEETGERIKDDQCILVMNNWERIPTCTTLELFAYRLYEAQRTADVNIINCKTPILLLTDENQKLALQNVYEQYSGNVPVIFADKNSGLENAIRSIDTKVEFIADKLTEYKKEIWNEALQFLGINNLQTEKKERLITDEANSNNEVINLNLQSYLIPRQEACKEFNEYFGLTGDKAISVKVRSDLHNIIKETQSSIMENVNKEDDIEEVDYE